jgi:hypothetical protein
MFGRILSVSAVVAGLATAIGVVPVFDVAECRAEIIPGAGSRIGHVRIPARGTRTFEFTFRGGSPAVAAVEGDGDTDLDLYVYDEDGTLVASDTDGTDFCIATWVPGRTGRFRIVIVNLGDVYNNALVGVR